VCYPGGGVVVIYFYLVVITSGRTNMMCIRNKRKATPLIHLELSRGLQVEAPLSYGLASLT
jgi:hypothetical protein